MLLRKPFECFDKLIHQEDGWWIVSSDSHYWHRYFQATWPVSWKARCQGKPVSRKTGVGKTEPWSRPGIREIP